MKKAFTLIELLVFMLILGFIIVVAGRVFSDSTGMRVRTQNMTKATEEVNKIAELIKEDMSQMGVKAWGISGSSSTTFDTVANVHILFNNPNPDYSSYKLTRNNPGNFDHLLFRKAYYDDNGVCGAVMEIEWFVKKVNNIDVLIRKCTPLENPKCTGTFDEEQCKEVEVEMATNVQTFVLLPSLPNDDPLAFGGVPATPGTPTFGLLNRGDNITTCTDICETVITPNTNTLSNFVRNASTSEKKKHQVFVAQPGVTGDYTKCEAFEFKKGETYAVTFKTPKIQSVADSMALFQPGVDHMAVGLRDSDNGYAQIGTDFMFYPPQENGANDINQYFEFSVPNDVEKACIAFTFAFYSGTEDIGPHKGSLKIQDFELSHKKDEAYTFADIYDPTADNYDPVYATESDGANKLKNKKNVKAFRLILEVNKRGEVASTRNINQGGYIIPTPNNGVTAKSTPSPIPPP